MSAMGPRKPRKRSIRSYERILRATVMNTQVTTESTTRGRNDHARRGTTRVLITLMDVPTTITRPREKESHSNAVTPIILDEDWSEFLRLWQVALVMADRLRSSEHRESLGTGGASRCRVNYE